LLLCVGSSFAFILSKQQDEAMDTAIINFSKKIYEHLNKKPNSSISKNEFCEWVKINVFNQGRVSINFVFESLNRGSDYFKIDI
jgi:hypothetical protein